MLKTNQYASQSSVKLSSCRIVSCRVYTFYVVLLFLAHVMVVLVKRSSDPIVRLVPVSFILLPLFSLCELTLILSTES